jgi:hypothetical protein
LGDPPCWAGVIVVGRDGPEFFDDLIEAQARPRAPGGGMCRSGPSKVAGETGGHAIYLRRFESALPLRSELTDEPVPGAPPWASTSSGGLLHPLWIDYLLIDAGEDGDAYVCEVLFARTLAAAKSLAVKAAQRDLNAHPQVAFKQPVDRRFQ